MVSQRSAVLIRITDDALVVANDGRPVSRLGVLALCASDLSEKSGREDEQPEDYPDTPDAELLRTIANSSIDVYRADINRAKRDLRHERGVKADYGGRYLWELLQNADDALASDAAEAAELIGTKGLGFISVLEITDRPEIFSRPFAFYFSKADTEQLLQSRLGKKIAAPTFEIPHPTVEPPEIAAVLEDGYATAIRLPFKNPETAARVRDDVENLDHRFLLLLQRLAQLQIDVSGRRLRKIDVTRSSVASGAEEIALLTRGVGWNPKVARWSKWSRHWINQGEDKRLSVAVCLPLDASAVPQALVEDDKPPVHVFFPTDEAVGARAIVHASLDVTENRKHFRASERNTLVYAQMRELIAEIVTAIPAEAALDAFGSIDPKSASGAARDLASTMLEAVKETPFVPTVGGEKVRPREVSVWPGNFGAVLRHDATELKTYCLLHPSVRGRNAVLQALQAKTVGALEFFGAMRFCRNNSLAECERVVDVLLHEGVPMLSSSPYHSFPEQVPCWWTEAGRARSIAGGILLFSRPRNWPRSVPADALSPEARRQLTAIDAALSGDAAARHKLAVWKDRIVGRFVHKGEYLEQALLPAMEAMKLQDWDEHGWEVLRWYEEWSPARKFDDFSGLPIIYHRELDGPDVFRRRLSRALRLPTEKGWRTAEQCYAGRSWGAPQSFRSYFKKRDDRAVVLPLRSWREPLRGRADLEAWKGLLRFAGVAWEPKLVPFDSGWSNRAYSDRHLGDFNRTEFDLQIEHFPDCLTEENRLLPLLEVGRTLLISAQKFPARYLAPAKQKSQTLTTNFAQHQLETTEWLPHRKSLLFPKGAVAAGDAYLAGRGIEGLLPEIALPDVEQRRKSELLRFLRAIGVKSSLPKDGYIWNGWMQRLADASRQATADKATLLDVARTLYRRLFNTVIDDFYPLPGLRVPCFVGGDNHEHLAFAPAHEVKWLDQTIFEAPEIRRALLAHGYRLFILFLNQADEADNILGMGRLSESISLQPVSAGIDEEGTGIAGGLYISRLRALRAVIPEAQRKSLTDELRIEATSRLLISMKAGDGREIAAPEVRAFRNRHGTLMVTGDGAYHRALGFGLAHYLVGTPRHTAIFENLLSAADEEEVIERLRDQGVPAQELDAVHAEMSKEKGKQVPASDSDSTDGEAKESSKSSAPSSLKQTPASPQSSGSHAITESGPSAAATNSSVIGRSSQARTSLTLGLRAPARESNSTETVTTGGGGNWDPVAIAAAGQHAEDWLFAKLTEAFPGWLIGRNERDASRRESDFVIRFDERQVHIEVKRLSTVPGHIYWSDLEFEKCGLLADDYCFALLLPSGDDYKVAWIWRPAIELASAERYIEWIWDQRRSDQLPDGTWQMRPPPPAPPRSFKYRIGLTPTYVNSLPKDAGDLSLLKGRIAGSATT
ncbi:hypothetical protein [Bradyrhizobium sp. CCBAU 11361]|uniref:hypothetical protein n=1 Tax=Bradyrhizobium sp. CCBAU 11361 TaxID=1630812 RepID=UPI002304E2CE|nr:hypothetical protein [Bradyrhizobium sp. CCBAU 11361]MDA9492370.1 hypothetical protein [Bradyrhizobium sp. CCBAU 11361]